MARIVKMTLTTGLLLIPCFFVAGSFAHELVFTHAPKYVSFQQQSKDLSTSDVSNVLASTMGLRTGDSSWDGMTHSSLFKRPKASVLITLALNENMKEGLPNLQKKASFSVKADQPYVDTENVANRIQSTFSGQDSVLIDLMAENNMINLQTDQQLFRKLPNSLLTLQDRLLDGDSIIHKLDAGSLNSSQPHHLRLFGELQTMADIVSVLLKNPKLLESKTPDLFNFMVNGLKSVADIHGFDSSEMHDAQRLLTDFIHYLTNEFRKVYKDNVVVGVMPVVPTKYANSRKSRSLMQSSSDAPPTTEAPGTSGDLNLASKYPETYPAMFNIILWFSIFLAITFFIIAYSMWFIDPGVDSIIYRMTSQRLKKD